MTYTDKDSKRPEYRELYERHDFIPAYARHTDMRIAEDGYKAAIGSNDKPGQGWDEHGRAQLNFLISQGLRPEHRLLDMGCGTGRLARQAAPYLDTGHYVGIDISGLAIRTARGLAESEGWDVKEPRFHQGLLFTVKDQEFHMIWAHSVFTHCPPEVIERAFQDLSEMGFGEFCFTYKRAEAPRRSGLKQFQYPVSWFIKTANQVGLQAEPLGVDWPAGQKTVRVWR